VKLRSFGPAFGLLCVWAAQAPSIALAQPIPEFFGVYAVTGGKLVELRPFKEERSPSLTLGNTAIQSPKFTELTGNVEFIIYSQDAAHFSPSIQRLARVIAQDELALSGRVAKRKKLENSWFPLKNKEALRIAPVSANPQMMLRAVPGKPLERGLWVLGFGGHYYLLGVGSNPTSAADCLVQTLQIVTLEYRDCGPGESAQSADAAGGERRGSDSAALQGEWTGALVEGSNSVPITLELKEESAGIGGSFKITSAAGELKEGSEFSIQDSSLSSGGLLTFIVPLGKNPSDWIGCKLALSADTLEGTCREQREGALALPVRFSRQEPVRQTQVARPPRAVDICSRRGTGIVRVDNAALQKKPDFRAERRQFLSLGTEVVLLGVHENDYCEVEVGAARGWVRSVSLKEAER
jgi:hypothetical protein